MDANDHEEVRTSGSPSDDPSETILAAWRAVKNKEISWAQATEIAGSGALARAATSETIERLIDIVATIALRVNKDSLSLADLIEKHASSLDDIGRRQEALTVYNAIQPVFEEHAGTEQLAQFHKKRARVLVSCGLLAEALAGLDLALSLLDREASPLEYAGCLMNRAVALRQQGKILESLAGFEEALPLFKQHASPADHARCLMNRATALWQQGKLADALAEFEEVLPILERHAPPADHACCLMNRATALWQQGKLADALAGFEEALPLLKRYSPGDHARCLMNRATTLWQLGRHAEAVAGFEEALPLLKRHAPPVEYARCLMNRATTLWQLGKHDEALVEFDEALPLLERHAPPADHARGLASRANALWQQGRHAEALAGFDEALPLLKRHASPADHARCLASWASALQSRHAEAVAGFDEALPLLKRHAPPVDYARFMMNRAGVFLNQGRHAEAVVGFDEALPLLKRHAPPADYAICLLNRATSLRLQGKYAAALADYEQALPLLKRHAPPARYPNCLAGRATTFWQQGKLADALAGYEEAMPLLEQYAPPADYARCLTNRASILRQQEKYAEALVGFGEARAVLRRARRRSRVDETSLNYTTSWAELYRLTVDCALTCNHIDQAHEAVCDGKAGLLGDLQHRLAEQITSEPTPVLQTRAALTDWMRNHVPSHSREPTDQIRIDKDRDEKESKLYSDRLTRFLDEREARTKHYLSTWSQHYHAYIPQRSDPMSEAVPTRRDIQVCLPDDWVILDFWWTENDEFLVFMLFKDDFRVEKLAFPLSKLQPKLDRLLESIRNPRETEPNLDALSDLYSRLFKPLHPLLCERGIRGLYLVPHDFLHGLPLHAAHNAKECRYLCDEFAIAYLPSAVMLPRLPRPNLSGSPFLLANPEAGTKHALPFSHWEGEQLRQCVQASSDCLLLGKAATLASTKSWTDAGLVHFSCHGLGDERFSPRSHLRLADDLLLAHDVLYRWPALKQGAVVVLNGCQTSVPDWRAVNEGMGLTSAFLLRGASLVLSTQWSVADGCAAEMVLEFVDKMRNGKSSPVDALQASRDRVRRMTADDILKRIEEVGKLFGEGSLEGAKVNAYRAWACWRAGLIDKAEAAAERASPVLREAGLFEEDERLRHLRDASPRSLRPVKQDVSYDSPVYWGAFQLVGRIV